jgi:hypothetical protein
MRLAPKMGSLSTEAGFCLWFFGLTIPLWIITFRLTRYLKKRFPAEHESFVDLPRLGRQLVRWRVREKASPLPSHCAPLRVP